MDVASQNCIIRGQLDDAFCLLCEQQLHTKRDLSEHIKNKSHQHNLLNSSYLDKYASHNIKRIKAVYYCELCSVVERVSIKADLHVKEPGHIQRRGTAQLKREGDLVIAFNDIAITERVWNGLADNTCMLCAIDFDEDLETHKNGARHSLNLIKSKVEFGEYNSIYRKIDSIYFHCLTCDKLVNFDIFKEHFNEDNHKEQYAQCRIFLQNTRAGNAIANKTIKTDNNNHISYMNEVNTKEIDCCNKTVSCGPNLQVKQLDDTQNDSVLNFHDEENTSNGSVALKHEQTLVSSKTGPKYDVDIKETDANVTYNTIEQNEHVDTVNTVVVFKDKSNKEIKSDASDEVIRNFARENNITWNFDNKNAYCRCCCVRIPNSLRCLQEHVYGQKHNGIKKTQRNEMITSSYLKELFVSLTKDVAVINSHLCVSALSFLLMTVNGNYTVRCQLCQVNILKTEIDTHRKMYKHRTTLMNVPVIQEENMESEFIREVRKNVYHCGHCNLLGDWPTLRDHLNSDEHKNMKQKSSEEFERHQPDLEDLRMFYSLQRISQLDPITFFYIFFRDLN